MFYTHYDRNGEKISAHQWCELMDDSAYRNIREFDNGSVRVMLVWSGKVTPKEHSSFRDTWPLFALYVANYDANGKLVIDPVMNGKTFAFEADAIDGYEKFLCQWTKCITNDDGEFVEVGNDLAPPPPPNPDAPTSVLKDTPDFGAAW